MPKAIDMIRRVKRGEAPPPPECDVVDDKDRLVARASSTCMTCRGRRWGAR